MIRPNVDYLTLGLFFVAKLLLAKQEFATITITQTGPAIKSKEESTVKI